MKAALASVAKRPAVPALALIVHGDDAAGQRAFLSALPGSSLKGLGPRQQATRLPIGQSAPALLPAWIAQTLGLPGGRAMHTPEELAERLAPELRSRPLYFILDRIGDLAGGATAFHEQFWLPLYGKLHQLRAAQPFSHRLVAYGFQPKDDNPRRLSITDLEYEEAVRLKKPCLAFLLHPEHAWPPGRVDPMSCPLARSGKLRQTVEKPWPAFLHHA